jgi:hypothetical protein
MTTKQSASPKRSTPKRSTPKRSTPKRSTPSAAAETTQLHLLDGGRTTPRAWQLDARTRRIGRQRVAEAREILRRAQPDGSVAAHDKIAG